MALDVETTGLGRDARIRSLQIGFAAPDSLALVFLLEHGDGTPDEDARLDAVRLLTAIQDVELWAYTHFDRRAILNDLGVPLRIKDAFALHHLVDNDAATRREPLKTEIRRRTGKDLGVKAEETLRMSVDDPLFIEYAALDAMVLIDCVDDWLLRCGWHPRRVDEWLHREARIADACHAMHERGLLLDQDEARRLRAVAAAAAARHKAAADVITGGVNLRSHVKIQGLIEARGVELPRTRKQTNGRVTYPKTTSHKYLHSDDALVLAVQGFRKQQSTVDTVKQWFDALGPDGRVHASFKPLGCRTSRWSSSRPNMQNVGKGSEDGEAGETLHLRSAFVARPGHVWVQADLSQIEYRVGAALSGDTKMLEAFAAGEDIHVFTAKVLSGKAEPSKADRKAAKGVGFGKFYGESMATSARKQGITETEMEERIERYDEAFGRLAEWCKEMSAASAAGRTPANPYRRELKVYAGYMGVNYLVQSTAREIFCTWMLNVIDAGYGPFLAAGIHDELILEVPEELAVEVRDAVVACAAAVEIPGHEGLVTIVANAQIADGSWAAAYEDD